MNVDREVAFGFACGLLGKSLWGFTGYRALGRWVVLAIIHVRTEWGFSPCRGRSNLLVPVVRDRPADIVGCIFVSVPQTIVEEIVERIVLSFRAQHLDGLEASATVLRARLILA